MDPQVARAPGPAFGAYGIWIDRPHRVAHHAIADIRVRDISHGFYEEKFVGFHSCAKFVFGRSDDTTMITLATHQETRWARSLAGGLALWLALAASQAVAQTLPPSAGAERTIRQPEAPTRTLLPPGRGIVAVPPSAPTPVAEIPHGSFVLRGMNIEGATAYGPDELTAIYADLLNEQIPYSDVYGIANRITAKYHADGYALSQAFVPGQTIENGMVTIWVTEGTIASFRIQGDPGGNRNLIGRYVKTLIGQRPLRTSSLERTLLLVNDLPGLSATGFIVPGPRGLMDAELVISVGYRSSSGTVGLDNRGSRFFGPGEVYATVQSNARLGFGELLEVSPMITGGEDGLESWGGFFNARVPVASNGGYVQAYLAGSETRPGGFIGPEDIEGKAIVGTLAYGFPLVREIDRYVYLAAQFDYIETNEDIYGNEPLIRDDLRVLRGHLALGQADRWGGENFADLKLSVGLDAFGASSSDDPLLSRPNASGDFVSIQASALRRQSLDQVADGLRLVVGFTGQYSPDELLSGEEFGLGGPVFLKAYDYYDISGDYGLAASVELQYETRAIESSWLNSAETFAFYDIGKIWNRDALDFELESGSAASLGGGIRATVLRRYFGSAYMAKPLTRDVTANRDRDLRFFFQLGIAW